MEEKKRQRKPRKRKVEMLNAREQKLREATEELNQKTRNAALELEKKLQPKFSKALGSDLAKSIEEAEEDYRQELKKLRQERENLKKDAKELAARQGEQFDRDLMLAVGKGGLEELIKKTYHNPALRMKYATEWHGETSPPLGMYGGMGDYEIPTASADYRFDTIEDPEFGTFCNIIHPYCFADAGSRRRGYASAWVTQRLTFTHPPPTSQILVDNVSITLTAFGYGESSNSSVIFFTMTLAMSFGGYSELLMSMWVEQDFIWPSGMRGTTRVDLVRDHMLAGFYSRGSVWVFGGVMAAPEWGPVNVRALRMSYPTMFPVYGTSNHREPLGEPVRVNVEFRCRAEADHRDAHGEMEFNEEGHRIKVHQVILEYPG